MKAIFLNFIVLTMASIGRAEKPKIIHNNCWDHSFSYNYMTVIETEEKIHFLVKGSDLSFSDFRTKRLRISTEVSLPKDQCFQSEDKRLVECWGRDVKFTNQAGIVDSANDVNPGYTVWFEEIQADRIDVSVRYTKTAMGHRSGYEFLAVVTIGDSTRVHKALFPAPENGECTQFPGQS